MKNSITINANSLPDYANPKTGDYSFNIDNVCIDLNIREKTISIEHCLDPETDNYEEMTIDDVILYLGDVELFIQTKTSHYINKISKFKIWEN